MKAQLDLILVSIAMAALCGAVAIMAYGATGFSGTGILLVAALAVFAGYRMSASGRKK